MRNEFFKSVLVMDSDLERRNIFYNVLTQSNHKVTTVAAYRELVEIIKKERPDYIIMDMSTLEPPGKGDILRRLREIDNNMKILALISGLAKGKVTVRRCIDDRIILLNKDIEIQPLLRTVLEILKEKSVNVEAEESKLSFKGDILVVDDEQESVDLVKNHLTRRGYTVDSAFSGEEAVLKVQTARPKVVILDILMPGMDGLMILNRIKEIDSAIAVIVTSGVQNDKIIKEAAKLGARAYLIKPYNLAKLEAAILASELGSNIKYFTDFFGTV